MSWHERRGRSTAQKNGSAPSIVRSTIPPCLAPPLASADKRARMATVTRTLTNEQDETDFAHRRRKHSDCRQRTMPVSPCRNTLDTRYWRKPWHGGQACQSESGPPSCRLPKLDYPIRSDHAGHKKDSPKSTLSTMPEPRAPPYPAPSATPRVLPYRRHIAAASFRETMHSLRIAHDPPRPAIPCTRTRHVAYA
jgi:hypothetical protein